MAGGKAENRSAAAQARTRAKSRAASERPRHLAHGRWLGDFRDLSEAEQALIAACAKGEWCILGGKVPQQSTPANSIRAALIRFLLLGGDDEHPVHEAGVEIEGAWIHGDLDLDMVNAAGRFALGKCRLSELRAMDAHFPALSLRGSHLDRLCADRLVVAGSVFLNWGFSVARGAYLPGAQIGSNLECNGGTFRNVDDDGTPSGLALAVGRATIRGSIQLEKGFSAVGEVNFSAVEVDGSIVCLDCTCRNTDPDGKSLGSALNADGAIIRGDLTFGAGFSAMGEVHLLDAEVGGNLICSGGSFQNPGKDGGSSDALSLDRATIKRSIFLDRKFSAAGAVRLIGANVGSGIFCTDGSFRNTDENDKPVGDAIIADGLIVQGSLRFGKGFSAIGEVRLIGADIGGNFSCSGGTFRNAGPDDVPLGAAVSADRALIKRDIFLDNGFSAIGEVRILGVKVVGDVYCDGGTFTNPIDTALILDGAEVSSLFLRNCTITGGIMLSTARIGSLVDDLTSWPAGRVILDGFSVDRIAAGPTDADSRIAWLKKQYPPHLSTDFRPQPWEQTIKVLREMGHPEAAKRVAIEKQRVWRRACKQRWRMPNWWIHKLYGIFAGYGYRPWWIVRWMLAICLVCTFFYYDGREAGLFGPTDTQIETQADLRKICGPIATGRIPWTSPKCPMPREYPSFQPFLYSLDVILPLIDLHQEPNWGPVRADDSGKAIRGWWLRWLIWFEILFGWAGSALLAAVAGNLVKKD